jgi:hypothetical protein
MKPILNLFLIALLFMPSLACGSFRTISVVGSGEIVNQTIEVSKFDRVTLEGFGDVFIEQGQIESLSVQTDDNIISFLDIRVRGTELVLGVERGADLNPSRSITYNLTVQNLNSITLAGSGTFHVDPVKSEDLHVSLSGSGDIEIRGLTADNLSIELNGSGNITLENVNVKRVDTSLRGSGDINLEGKTDTQKVAVSGSGNYLAGSLQTNSMDIRIPGSGDITVWVEDELNVNVDGSGNIRYYGKPNIDQSGFGSGDITSLGEK